MTEITLDQAITILSAAEAAIVEHDMVTYLQLMDEEESGAGGPFLSVCIDNDSEREYTFYEADNLVVEIEGSAMFLQSAEEDEAIELTLLTGMILEAQ